jgi:glutamate dehydrogenase
MADPSRLRDIERRLVDVLRDVRDAVEDWAKMREAAQRIADELHESPPNLPPEEIADTWELLRWLIDEHFTFLGYREYSLQSHDGEDVLVTKPGSGLGLLRGDHAESASFSKLPPEVRAKARERQLLILTKANSRSTVHRPAYLDYIGIKSFDARGDVVGERRFIGLFTSSTYSTSPLQIPLLRHKVQRVIDQIGVSSVSHDGSSDWSATCSTSRG